MNKHNITIIDNDYREWIKELSSRYRNFQRSAKDVVLYQTNLV